MVEWVSFGVIAVVLIVIATGKRPLEQLAIGLCLTALFALLLADLLLSANGVLVVGVIGFGLCSLAAGIVVTLRIQDSNWLVSTTG